MIINKAKINAPAKLPKSITCVGGLIFGRHAIKASMLTELLHCKRKAFENPIQMSGSHLRISRNETVQSLYFQNRIIMFCLLIPTLIYSICGRFTFPGSVCLFCCSQICGHMNVGIGTEVTQFLFWEYIHCIFGSV